MPACVLTNPEVAACRRPTTVPTSNNVAASTLSADVSINSTVETNSAAGSGFKADDGATDSTSVSVFAVTALAAGTNTTNFARTPLSPSLSWQAGRSAGDFTTSYPITVPPAPAGPAPQVSLQYSSGSVDGRTAAENAQPSWLGEGWDYSPGYIERSYRACADDLATGRDIGLYAGNGTGGFTGALTTAASLWDAESMASTGDFDGDGFNDMIFRRTSNKYLYLARGNGHGGWLTDPKLVEAADWSGAMSLFSADFTGDGKPDMLYRDGYGQLFLRTNNGAGGLTASAPIIGYGFELAGVLFSPGDFNGDGKADMLYNRPGDGTLFAVWGNGAGGWITGTSISIGAGWGTNMSAIFAKGDFSGDAKPDVLWRNASNGDLNMVRGNGAGSWVTGGSELIGTGWGGFDSLMVAGDASGDGKPDIWTAKASTANPYHAAATADLCWRDDNATIVWNGRSSQLVKDDTTGTWRLANDDGSKVERLTGTTNGDNDGEHWRITTQDGTQYYFGLNRLPGWTTGKRETQATWTAPVFANHSGEPCFSTASFLASRCTQAWRWNLDYVVDPNQNSMSYWYSREQANTGLAGDANTVTGYERGGWLSRIEYGTRSGQELANTTPPRQVLFTMGDRCLSSCWSGSTPVTANWPDTPWDLNCTTNSCPGNPSPSFWSSKWLTTIATQTWDGFAYRNIDSWALSHTLPLPDDQTTASAWLSDIVHTGQIGSALSLPAVRFDPVGKYNRMDYNTSLGVPPVQKFRIGTVNTETGGQILVTYENSDCTPAAVPDPDLNTQRCFPQYYKPPTAPAGWSWWNKYRVSQITERDVVGGGTDVFTAYSYSTAGSSTAVLWHHNDRSSGASIENRSWSDWRGYSTVTTTAGAAGGTQSQTKDIYMRGMNADRTDAGWQTRTATITSSENVILADDAPLAGFLREHLTYSGAGGQLLSATLYDPWQYQTGRQDEDPYVDASPAINATFVRTSREQTRTWIAATSTWRRTDLTRTFDNTYGQQTLARDLGDITTTTDDVCTSTTFARNTSSYLIAYPAETLSTNCATTPGPSDHVAGSRVYYDQSTTLGAGPSKGLATRIDTLTGFVGQTAQWPTTAKTDYDALGRPVKTYDGLDRATTTTYFPATGVVTRTEVTNAAGHTVATTIDANRGLPLTVVDANGKITNASYDPLGRLIKVWLPGRPTDQTPNTEYVYTVRNDAMSSVQTKKLGPNGNQISSFEIYDGLTRARTTQTTSPDGNRWIVDTVYDSRGLAVKQSSFYNATPPNGQGVTYTDASVTTQTRTTYDGAGRPTNSELWSLGTLKWGTATAYDGDRTSVTPPAGGTATMNLTDARGRTNELRQYTTAGAPTGAYLATAYRYDRVGRLTGTTDTAGNVWSTSYDLRGRTTQTIDPDKGTTSYSYDNANQLTSTTDARGIVLSTAYDNLGRATALWQGAVGTGTQRATWVYDTIARGQLGYTSRIDGYAYTTTVTGYDDAYRPLGVSVTFPTSEGALSNQAWTVSTTYNVDGSVATQTTPSGGGLSAETITMGYSNTGYPTTAVSGLGSYVADTVYYQNGGVYQRLLGASGKQVRLTTTVDQATGRLTDTQVHTQNQTTPTTWDEKRTDTYAYTNSGLVTSTTEKVGGAIIANECFTTDRLQRLTEAWTTTAATCQAAPSTGVIGGADPYWTTWAYDNVGNRTSQNRHGLSGAADTTTSYATPIPGGARPHSLSSSNTTGPSGSSANSYGYDQAGNTTSRVLAGTSQTLTWDPEGHLATQTIGGQTTTYLYTPDGDRLLRRDPDGTTTAYLGGYEVTKATSGTLTATRYYTAGGTTIASRNAAGLTWLASDHHGTAQTTINPTALTTTTRRTMPYGETRGTPPTWPNDKNFVGGTQDPTGLTHLGAREYDTATGRFASVDPIQDLTDPQQWHGYAYANNSPASASDPTGLILCGDDNCNQVAVKTGSGYSVSGTPIGNPKELAVTRYTEHVATVYDPVTDQTWINEVPLPKGTNTRQTVKLFLGALSDSNQRMFWPNSWNPDTSLYDDPDQIIGLLQHVCGYDLCGAGVGKALFAMHLEYVPVGGGEGPGILSGAGPRGSKAPRVTGSTGATIEPGKWDYLFGNVTSGPHNTPRSTQNQAQFARIGVYNNAEGRAMLQSHLDRVVAGSANNVRTFVNEHGSFVVKNSLFAGPGGFVRLESTWQITDSGFRLTTVIPFGGR
jgi:RHS repeat-associated protein